MKLLEGKWAENRIFFFNFFTIGRESIEKLIIKGKQGPPSIQEIVQKYRNGHQQ